MPDPDVITRVPIRRAAARPLLVDDALVLEVAGIEHELVFDGHQWSLLVPTAQANAADRELRDYVRENEPAPAPVRPVPVDSGGLGVLGYLLVIWSLPWLENAAVLTGDLRALGGLDVTAVRDGEVWRAVTALTLHGDLGHLVANSAFGALFGALAGRWYGSGVAWLLILGAGIAGNLLNTGIQGDGFRSIGASTATFGALALVGAGAWRRGWFRRGDPRHPADRRRSLAPVFGGIALLIYTGLGGESENVDVIGHLCGFAAGFVLGVAAAPVPARVLNRPLLQWVAGASALVVVALAWRLATRAAAGQ
jgi:membrane associated rhomboid family serine protease